MHIVLSKPWCNNNKAGVDKLKFHSKYFLLEDPFLWMFFSDQIIYKCVSDHEFQRVLKGCHDTVEEGHFGRKCIVIKFLDCGFFWLTLFKDAYKFVKNL